MNKKLEGSEVLKRLCRYFKECKRSFIRPTCVLLSKAALKSLKQEYPKRVQNNSYLEGKETFPIYVLEDGQVEVGVSLAFVDFKEE